MSTLRGAVGASAVLVGVIALAVVPGVRSQIYWWIFLPFWLALTWRVWIVGIRVEAEGIRVRGFLVSRRVPWDEVDHFAVLPLGNYPYVGHVVLRDGRRFGTYGISSAARPKSKAEHFRGQVKRPIDELNEVLATRRERAADSDVHTAGSPGRLPT